MQKSRKKQSSQEITPGTQGYRKILTNPIILILVLIFILILLAYLGRFALQALNAPSALSKSGYSTPVNQISTAGEPQAAVQDTQMQASSVELTALVVEPAYTATFSSLPTITATNNMYTPEAKLEITQENAGQVEIAGDILCSPISGVEINEITSIISQVYNVINPRTDFGHHGVDLGSYSFKGQYLYDIPIKSILPGKIAGVINDRPPLGNAIIIETTYMQLPEFLRDKLQITPWQSLYHLYAHLLSSPDWVIGKPTHCGEEIARLGKSQTVEAHLHLETRIGRSGSTFGSMAFYDTSASEEELAEYLRWRTSGDFSPFDPMMLFTEISDMDAPGE